MVELLVVGVLVLNEVLMEASVGSPNTASMNFNWEPWHWKTVSMYPALAKGEMMSKGTRTPGP